MAQWITDRLPTAEDGDVKIKTGREEKPEAGFCAHYSVIVLGQPWWSRNAVARAAQPAPPPAPASTRVVTAMAANEMRLYATCNDGTIWQFPGGLDRRWYQLPSIPQPEAPDA